MPHGQSTHERKGWQMYQAAFRPFSIHRGTPYRCTQEQIDFHFNRSVIFDGICCTPHLVFTEEVVRHNSLSRIPGEREQAAIYRLQEMFSFIRGYNFGGFGPDLAVKAFRDIQYVFFLNYLGGRCTFDWEDDEHFGGPAVGITHGDSPGYAHIRLNAQMIFLETRTMRERLDLMISTLLHEMCVSATLCFL